jgi:hypothetical protein
MACVLAASAAQDLPPVLLQGIAAVEGGQIGTASRNRDGSYDLGPFQVNTRWLPFLEQAYSVPRGRLYTWLRDDGCFNAGIAAWILRREIDRSGNLWFGVGRYHSADPMRSYVYYLKVARWVTSSYGNGVIRQGESKN